MTATKSVTPPAATEGVLTQITVESTRATPSLPRHRHVEAFVARVLADWGPLTTEQLLTIQRVATEHRGAA